MSVWSLHTLRETQNWAVFWAGLGTDLSLAHRSNCGWMPFLTSPMTLGFESIDHEPQALSTKPRLHGGMSINVTKSVDVFIVTNDAFVIFNIRRIVSFCRQYHWHLEFWLHNTIVNADLSIYLHSVSIACSIYCVITIMIFSVLLALLV